ncbi:MAG: hypothetical protein LQ352_000875 [Teloschistes flavicans]|nr:MAG: hypothetical protein LQ352_000875 [Teloschistes flavicans]
MDKAITQALMSLIPELNGPLTPELLDLASSLLAQSRTKASSLKADEEIGRTYACANLACERLKQNLGLPKIQPRPPCPPRVYQKLYQYLDSTLAVRVRRTTRQSKPSETAAAARSSPVTPRRPTQATARTPHSARSGKRKREFVIVDEVPSWAMPVIRALCKRLGVSAATPHVFAGVSSVLTLPPPNYPNPSNDQILRLRQLSVEALIVAVYIHVQTRRSGSGLDTKDYALQRDKALAIISELREGGDKFVTLQSGLVNEWLDEVNKGCWIELDWFTNVEEGVNMGAKGSQADGSDKHDSCHTDDDEGYVTRNRRLDWQVEEASFLQPGLGTMMQDKLDYLSDEKRAEYQRWKKGFLARIEQKEKTQSR